MERWRIVAGVRCGCSDGDAWMHGGMEEWSSGVFEECCRRADVEAEVSRYEALKVRNRCADMQAWSPRWLKVCCRGAEATRSALEAS